MFPEHVYTRVWADQQRKKLGNCDPVLLERCVRALTLLGHLAESGLPFLFKGGTSLLLHLPEIRRLSIDIDIVSSASDEELDSVVAMIAATAPFAGSEESVRGTTPGRQPLPRRRHFKLWFANERQPGGRDYVLLDVVREQHQAHETVAIPIKTSFLQPEREISVTVPTVESLLGDKLTAFAPTTIGVKVRYPNNEEGEVMQVAKQLFDVGILFEHATDFSAIARTYDGVQAQESGYRGSNCSRAESLEDTLNACLGITTERLKGAPADKYPDAILLANGFRKLQGHLTMGRLSDEFKRQLAARAAILALHLRANKPLNLADVRYTGSPGQLAVLRAASLRNTPYPWIESLKATNPEAYHLWYHGLQVL